MMRLSRYGSNSSDTMQSPHPVIVQLSLNVDFHHIPASERPSSCAPPTCVLHMWETPDLGVGTQGRGSCAHTHDQ